MGNSSQINQVDRQGGIKQGQRKWSLPQFPFVYALRRSNAPKQIVKFAQTNLNAFPKYIVAKHAVVANRFEAVSTRF